MKKVFNLKTENKNPDRLLESIKYEIRKYIKREKNKKLPEGVDFWKFDCKFGQNDEEPKVIEFVDITKHINEAVQSDCESFYMEIISTEGIREKKEVTKTSETIENSITEEDEIKI